MSKFESNGRTSHSTVTRKKYAIGQGVECVHPVKNRMYLGHQGEGAYYQCRLCKTVIVSYVS